MNWLNVKQMRMLRKLVLNGVWLNVVILWPTVSTTFISILLWLLIQWLASQKKYFNKYSKLILDTTDNDPTVLKTIKNYYPTIVYNTSNIHFILHNTYSTLNYYIPENHDVSFLDIPTTMIVPISNNLCICLTLQKDQTDLTKKEFKLKIEQWNEDEPIKQFFIDGYIPPQATSFIVDDTNLKYVKRE